MSEKDKILVVDDEKHIVDILSLYLKKAGFEVLTADNGLKGLEAAKKEKPLLIVSDSMMPEMDGLEFCKKIKEDEELKDIFFILLTGRTTTEEKIEGLDIGADEYLTKPFNNNEIIARINAFMRISKLQQELKEKNTALEKLDKLKNDLTHMIVHDMKTPIGGILLTLDIMLDKSFGDNLNDDQMTFLSNCKHSANELFNMVLNLLDINKMEEGKMVLDYEMFNPYDVAKELELELIHMAKAREVNIVIDFPEKDKEINADRQIIKRILMNLLTNALKHTPSNGDSTIYCQYEGDKVILGIKDTGEGISEEFIGTIFNKFTTVKSSLSQKFDTGLGLTFCKMATESHKGEISVESEPGKGSNFFIKIPIK